MRIYRMSVKPRTFSAGMKAPSPTGLVELATLHKVIYFCKHD